ncbi:MAG: hypothetical protein OXH68_15480 [Gammaproteobacteria bacterium]|nr:hypothetical protein [Gammaproteobacteria bacterium]
MRARFRRARSTRPPNPDSASGDGSPSTYGLFRNQLFNDDASRNRAELEPIDYLTRSTTPHAGHVTIALAVVAITVALWLTLGSIDQSLWLTGKLLDAPAADAETDDGRGNVIRIETEVRLPDAERLLSGREVSVFRNTYAGAFLSGTIHGVNREGPGGIPGRTDTLHLDVAYDPALFEPPSRGEANYRLRIPVGSQRPIDLLLRLARPDLSREP